jgi:predicted DNA-binding transcriptional regulator AlpA
MLPYHGSPGNGSIFSWAKPCVVLTQKTNVEIQASWRSLPQDPAVWLTNGQTASKGDQMNRKYLTPTEVETMFGVKEKTLANWRSQGRGPKYHKIGKLIRYSTEDLQDWGHSKRILTFGLLSPVLF